MKKFIVLFVLAMAIKNTEAQIRIDLPIKGKISGTITKFNFHKPRTDCKSGFGFCLKTITNFSISINEKERVIPSSVKGDNVFVSGYRYDNAIELHIPGELSLLPEFAGVDFNSFVLEDGSSATFSDGSRMARLKGGTYKVSKLKDEYVVVITTD